MAEISDPVRDRVEATLRRFVDVATTGPCGILRTAQRTATQTAEFARTVINLTVDGLLGWDVDAGVPPRLGATASATATTAPAAPRRAVGAPARRGSADAGSAADLAIAGYEDLPASHIVARLERLDDVQLAEVRRFELAHRGRRTVVGKIDQLLAQR
jgi:hypothetical protein